MINIISHFEAFYFKKIIGGKCLPLPPVIRNGESRDAISICLSFSPLLSRVFLYAPIAIGYNGNRHRRTDEILGF